MASGDTLSCWDGCKWAIQLVDADGKQRHFVKRGIDRGVTGCPAPAWSPTGRRILYCRTGGIYVVDASGQNDHRVTPLPSDELVSPKTPIQLAWSPNGRSIVYVSNRGRLDEVGMNGRGKVELTSPHDRVLDPSWVAN
jgi:Tol biopolymer transport system component